MQQEKREFPDDSNGAVLKQLWDNGDDLTKPREFDFGVIFDSEENALEFAVALLKQKLKVSFSPPEEDGDIWQIQCHPTMVPEHERISKFESSLARMAGNFGGSLDGWDCFVILQ